MASDHIGSPSPSLKLFAWTLIYISINWLLLVSIRTCALHIVCDCVTVVLGFTAHSTISGIDYDAEDCSKDDRYDSMGYGLDFEEFLAECSN